MALCAADDVDELTSDSTTRITRSKRVASRDRPRRIRATGCTRGLRWAEGGARSSLPEPAKQRTECHTRAPGLPATVSRIDAPCDRPVLASSPSCSLPRCMRQIGSSRQARASKLRSTVPRRETASWLALEGASRAPSRAESGPYPSPVQRPARPGAASQESNASGVSILQLGMHLRLALVSSEA